jgi:hypothetical protein
MYYSQEETKRFQHAFSSIAPAVEEFTKKYNLFIEKYYYGGPKWTLLFRRTKGGVVQIYINYLQANDFNIGVIWHIDEFETLTRHARHEQIGTYIFRNDLEKLSELLENALQIVRNWSSKDLDEHHSNMTIWKQHWSTKEEFEQAENKKYPLIDI